MWKRLNQIELMAMFAFTILLLTIAIPAVAGQMKRQQENALAGEGSNIGLAMFNYELDHDAYPSGPTSTAIFQELYDRHYLGDGKRVALSPLKVQWDVSEHADGTGLTSEDPVNIPLLISTGLGPQRFQDPGTIRITIPIFVKRVDQASYFIRPSPTGPYAPISPSPNPKGTWYKTVTP
jgi:hypothetical protein